ncbi:MAG TPA: hypothetical protein VK530_11695 [Candidatus Acidoferrum sp.]|nr:hypothetical protein [Candidatus Acidoferrum sp.]
MKSLIALTLALFVTAPALLAGEDCAKTCDKAKAAASACEKSKAAACESSKGECPKAKLALRKALLTHKGAQLAVR